MRTLPLLLSIMLLAACSGGETPQPASFVPPATAKSAFGDLRVHYNALPTLALSEAAAREYGVPRDADHALVVIALRRAQAGDETMADGEVAVIASDLSGKRQQIALHPVRTGDYVDHVGSVRISPRDSLRFDVTVKADGKAHELQFQRNF
jgi:hypothetical protein